MTRVIIGAGIYGLYAAYQSGLKGYDTIVLEADNEGFSRGSYVNQARLHSGYHYPRSKSTAQKSRDYFFRFLNDFKDAINTDFTQLYGISTENSLTDRAQFIDFCRDLNIKCDEVDSSRYLKEGSVQGLFDTLEYTIDCKQVETILLNKIHELRNVSIIYNCKVTNIKREQGLYKITADKGVFTCDWVLNATYASVNQITNMLGLPGLELKYELCEVILGNVSNNIKKVGITVMDGPFFSIMPFGNTGLHSLTSVCHTPHTTSYTVNGGANTPSYECQHNCDCCSKDTLGKCLHCAYNPHSSIDKMMELAHKYLNDDIKFTPVDYLFSVKPILMSCEKDDARPTIIKTYDEAPNFYTVFSGKLNTIYDLDGIL